MRLSENERQCAHLVIENCELKNKLSTLEDLYHSSQNMIDELEF
jgi:hypothetical protein